MAIFRLGRKAEPEKTEASRRVANSARRHLGLGDDYVVTASQIECGDPACEGGAETFILVMRKGERTRGTKVSKAMALVTEKDVTAAVRMMR